MFIRRTTATFFAVLAGQSRCEMEHSLERWHKRIGQIFQVHQTEAATEVRSSSMSRPVVPAITVSDRSGPLPRLPIMAMYGQSTCDVNAPSCQNYAEACP